MLRRHAPIAVLLSAALGNAGCGGGDEPGQNQPPPVPQTLQIVDAFPALQFDDPLYLTTAPLDSGRVFVVTQRGRIFVIDNDPATPTAKVFLDIEDRVIDGATEMGLLGLAFDPAYRDNGFFYVNYNPVVDATHPRRTLISRFQVTTDPDVADPASETVLLSYEQPFGNHKGGWLGFGPDEKLYVASGDGGGAGDPDNRAQRLDSLLGKILRVERDGSVPADNPFVATPGARGEIWAYGFRNPFRASFDRNGGALWLGDVGQALYEEVDVVDQGGNYGWRKFEGNHVFNAGDPDPGNAIAPRYEYDHSGGRCTIIGGYKYRGAALGPHFAGGYFFADFCTGEVFHLRDVDSTAPLVEIAGRVPAGVTSFGEDTAGELYLTSFGGHVYRLERGAN